MSDYKYTIVQDGTLLKSEIEKIYNGYFTYRDIKSNNEGDYFNFVGFIFTEDEALVSFPKHFFSEKDIINKSSLNIDKYLNLLFRLIQKCMTNNNKRLVQVNQEINKSYPFEPFYKIYEYYQRYGLFTQEREIKKFGQYGKILWKDTFNKSPIVINHGNILFMPPVIQKRVTDYVFISKCMAYVINSTIDKFHFLFNLPRVNLEYRDINFTNSDRIIGSLKNVKQFLFKDIHLQLIEDLIAYFNNENRGSKHIEIKIYSFHLIWEEMVRNYLNKYFLEIDDENEELIFESTGDQKHNLLKREFELDRRRKIKGLKTYKIEPDFYFEERDKKYIFDAKYFTEINKLDYKQISYYFLLKNYENDLKLKIYNGLILPTSEPNMKKVHFNLDKEFSEAEEEFKIVEYYLNMQKLMQIYLNNN
ncbi:LlaJI family restriction endonuclease [Bacillus dakarensis]|uniref:LlaJI family restriction endonuclease n=1 Tax=Robertmurraya dakarensis TaxID=1926278 RepID=UPI000981AE82|nr:LlaJI family restriction endonuclease [Bacillus dakarensis]